MHCLLYILTFCVLLFHIYIIAMALRFVEMYQTSVPEPSTYSYNFFFSVHASTILIIIQDGTIPKVKHQQSLNQA